jgi:TPR repeat protein
VVKWYRKAADQGYSYAQGCLGLAYANGMGNLDEDYNEAVKWYRKAADQGYSYAQCSSFAQDSLWWSHVDGMGVFKDGKKAVKWCLKAVDRGELDAKDLLASIYNFGLAGVYKNDKEAVKWMSEALEETNDKEVVKWMSEILEETENRETKSDYW